MTQTLSKAIVEFLAKGVNDGITNIDDLPEKYRHSIETELENFKGNILETTGHERELAIMQVQGRIDMLAEELADLKNAVKRYYTTVDVSEDNTTHTIKHNIDRNVSVVTAYNQSKEEVEVKVKQVSIDTLLVTFPEETPAGTYGIYVVG